MLITATTTPTKVLFESIFWNAYQKRTLQIQNKWTNPVEIMRDEDAIPNEHLTLRNQDSSNTVMPSETFRYISVVSHTGTSTVSFTTW